MRFELMLTGSQPAP